MKLSFSTLACPDWSFREIYAAAADLGYDGIEIRGIADEIYAPKIYNFTDEKIESAKAHLEKRNLKILALTIATVMLMSVFSVFPAILIVSLFSFFTMYLSF